MNRTSSATLPCKICQSKTSLHGQGIVRRQHPANYLRCDSCGFIFVENASWLAEAYASPINISDTGYVARNLRCRESVGMFIELFLQPGGLFLDYGAGYGLFVRLMRDAGYDFCWADEYCQNLFARGFEANPARQGVYEAVTAFEVMEHLVDPLQALAEIAATTKCLIFTTDLVPKPAPGLNDWGYYALEHGQHVSFYTVATLEFIAKKFGFHLVSDGSSLHALTREPIAPSHFQRIDNGWWRRWIRRRHPRRSLMMTDHEKVKQQLAHQ